MRGSFIRMVHAMRGSCAERVTTVHRSLLAAQWPEVHLPGRSARHVSQTQPGSNIARNIGMNIGLFGGSFDPIHRGHLTLAQAAAKRYSLRQVLFVPANVPPHKQKQPLTAFIHRYAMVALGTQDERGFVPSLLEAPASTAAEICSAGRTNASVPTQGGVNYSIDTVRRLKR